MCMRHATPSAYLDLCQLWELDQRQERDAIPQVIFNNKEFNQWLWFQWTVPRWARMGSICHSFVVSTTQFARDNDDANIDVSSQHDVLATLREDGLSESELNLHNKLPNAVQLRPESRASLLAERPRVIAEFSFEAVSYYDLAQNLETVQFLISKKDLDKPNGGYPIVHKERCNSILGQPTSNFLLRDEKPWIDLEEADMQFFVYTITVMVYQF